MAKDLPIRTQEALKDVISEEDKIIWVDGIESNIVVLTSINLEVEAFFAIEETEREVDGLYATLHYKPKNDIEPHSTRISVKLDEVPSHLRSWMELLHRLRNLNSDNPWFTTHDYDAFTEDLDKILETVLTYQSEENTEWIVKEISDLKKKVAGKGDLKDVSESTLVLIHKISKKIPRLFNALLKEVFRESFSQALQPFFDILKSLSN